jgi:hypothetical protein
MVELTADYLAGAMVEMMDVQTAGLLVVQLVYMTVG